MWSLFSPFTFMWVLGIRLGLSGCVAGAIARLLSRLTSDVFFEARS